MALNNFNVKTSIYSNSVDGLILLYRDLLQLNNNINLEDYLILVGSKVDILDLDNFNVDLKFIDGRIETIIDCNFIENNGIPLVSGNERFKKILREFKNGGDTTKKLFIVVFKLKPEKKDEDQHKKKDKYKPAEIPKSHEIININPLSNISNNLPVVVVEPEKLSAEALKLKGASEFLSEISLYSQSNSDIDLQIIQKLEEKCSFANNDLLKIKANLDIYEYVTNKEMFKILKQILTKAKDSVSSSSLFNNINDYNNFSMETFPKYLLDIARKEVEDFNKKIENLKSKEGFSKLQNLLEKELSSIIYKLHDLYIIKKQDYLLEREKTKQIKDVFEPEHELKINYNVERSHDYFEYEYACCGCKDIDNPGCSSYVEEQENKGSSLVKIVSFGIFGGPSKKFEIKAKHLKAWQELCSNCHKGRDSSECMANVKSTQIKNTHLVLKDKTQTYTKDDWNDSHFKEDVLKLLNKVFLSNVLEFKKDS